MKVNQHTSLIDTLQNHKSGQKSADAKVVSLEKQSKDVDLSLSTTKLNEHFENIKTTDISDNPKVAALKAQVQSGEYKINAHSIAEKIISSMETLED